MARRVVVPAHLQDPYGSTPGVQTAATVPPPVHAPAPHSRPPEPRFDDFHSLTLRVPIELYAAAKAAAKDERVSISRYVRDLLREAVQLPLLDPELPAQHAEDEVDSEDESLK